MNLKPLFRVLAMVGMLGTMGRPNQIAGPPPKQKVDPVRPDAQPRAGSPTSNYDPFKTGVQNVPTNVAIAAGSTLTIADMLCEVVAWPRDTRSVTCALSGSQPAYSGVLIVHFTDRTAWSKTVFVEQPINAGVRSTWGVAAMLVYGAKEIMSVEFSNGGTLAEWEQTPAAQAVLKGTYSYPTPQATYPPSVHVREMLCHGSEFLIGKSQAEITPTYSITCVLAGNVQYYGGWLSIWWHQFESRLAEKNTPAPVPKAQSTRDVANHTQYVVVSHDATTTGQRYWGVAALLVQSPVKLAVDRVNFYPEREDATWILGQPPLGQVTPLR